MANFQVRFYTVILPAVQDIKDNFSNGQIRPTQLAGADGGFYPLLDNPPYVSIGRVEVTCVLVADAPGDMQAKIDQLKGMTSYGLRNVFIIPQDGTEVRFTKAVVDDVQILRQVSSLGFLKQQVKVILNAPDPHWYTLNNESYYLTDGFLAGDPGLPAGGVTPTNITYTGSIAVANAGTSETYPRITITPPATKSVTNVTIERRSGTTVLEQVVYTGALAALDVLEINCRKKSVTLNGVGAIASLFWTSANWLTIPAGGTTLYIGFFNAADNADVAVMNYHSYR